MADSASRKPGKRPARPDPKTGEPRRVVRLGKYEVVEHIATGGMGAVYRARDTDSGREVALKILMPEFAAKPAMLERFRREARSADKLDHENIVRQFDFGEINGTHYLAMEFVDGVDLHDHLEENGPLDPEEARFIVLQGARALRHSHAQNIVHRDVKPSNFLLTRKNRRPLVKLADFGLAREVDADEFRVTRAGTTVGTVDYMSPEQAKDSSSADIRSDLYSLGSTWYHLLAGHAPFNKGGLGERLIKIMHEEPPDVREINPRVSEECWDVLQKLLAKDADDRYQSPAELIDELLALEGRTTTSLEDIPRKAAKKKSPKKKQSTQHDSPITVADDPNRKLYYVLGGVGAAILLAIIVLLSVGRRPPTGDDSPPLPPVAGDPVAGDPLVPIVGENDKGKEVVKVDPVVPIVPQVGGLPWLATTAKAVDAGAMREEVEKPWAGAPPVAADAVVLKVSRAAAPSATSFRSLAEACAGAPADKAVVIEIADNGPLFERSPGRMEGRDVVVRAAKGYRPLVVWDLPATLPAQPGKADAPLFFLAVGKGRLFVEGVEFAWRWPDTLERPAVFFDAEDSDLSVADCTVSGGGNPKKGITLARFRGGREVGLCRLTRCRMRGAGLVALDLDAQAAEVLVDGCLLCGGDLPLIRVRASAKAPKVRVARSTLVGGATMLELTPADADKAPPLAWLGWDSLFSRSAPAAGGSLVALAAGFEASATEWRSVNCLYAGFADLLGGAKSVPADLGEWQKHWARVEIDRVARDPWPELVFLDPSKEPASSYAPAGAVRFAATADPARPLGCDLAALPPARDGWMTLAYDPTLAAPDLPSDDDAPPIPQIADGRFHGAAVNLDETDLGDYLARIQATTKLGPKVVLHLSGKGDRPTSPVRVKGASLVLHFEEPADKTTRLGLVFTRTARPVPLLDVEGGSLEVIGGFLRVPDTSSLRVSHVVRVTGGSVRLYKTRLEGPQQSVPEGYLAALSMTGSGDPDPEKGHTCAVNECALFSSQVGISVVGVGCRLAMRQSVVVAGTEGLEILPGTACKRRAGISCSLVASTFACRRAVLRLGDAPNAGLPSVPVVVNARECAYLNPFPGKPSKAGLVVWDGDSLARGLLLWQGEREGYDPRLHFALADNSQAIPEAKGGLASWKTLWGSAGVRRPRDLTARELGGPFDARGWAFERLVLKGTNPPGANIERLGLTKRKG